MIDTIIFDLSEVCVNGLMGFEKVLSRETGVNVFLIDQYLHDSKMTDAFTGKITERQYFEKFKNDIENAVGGLYSGMEMPALEIMIRRNFTEVPGMGKIIVALKEDKDYKLGLLSDHMREWVEYIENTRCFLRFFDKKIYSFKSGYTKASSLAFEYALSKLQAKPENVLFIDDQSKNLEVAASAGIKHLHHFSDAERLRKDLMANYGIDVAI